MSNPFQIPASWDDLYLPDKPKYKSQAFWTCVISTVYALVAAVGFLHKAASIGLLAMAALIVTLFYLLWRFLAFVDEIRAMIRNLSAADAALILSSARTNTRIFYSMMFLVGIAFNVSRLFVRY